MTTDNWLQSTSDGNQPIVAIAVVPDNYQHTGIVYTDADDRFMFLHLAWHCILCHDAVPECNSWVVPSADIHPTRLEHVAAMCERIWARNREHGIPYGFRYDASAFRKDGTIALGSSERGFTCATFVLAVFRTVGVEILRLNQWPHRSGDEMRFEKLLTLLRKTCQDNIHVNAVSAETKSIRYRALEVAGGARHSPPTSFADASSSAILILRDLILPFLENSGLALHSSIVKLLESYSTSDRDSLHRSLDKLFKDLEEIHADRNDALDECLASNKAGQATENNALFDESSRLRARYNELKSA